MTSTHSQLVVVMTESGWLGWYHRYRLQLRPCKIGGSEDNQLKSQKGIEYPKEVTRIMKRVIGERTVILQYSPMSIGNLANIETMKKANVMVMSKRLYKEICKIVCRGNLLKGNISTPDKVPQVVVAYINVHDFSMVPGVLHQCNSPSAVPLNDSWFHKINIHFFRPGLCPYLLLGTSWHCHVFSFNGRQSHGHLSLAAPSYWSSSHGKDIPWGGLSSIPASPIISVSVGNGIKVTIPWIGNPEVNSVPDIPHNM